MAMNMSGALRLIRRYTIDHHQRDSKLQAYHESLVGDHGEVSGQSQAPEHLRELVISHERDTRDQSKGREVRRRGTLRQATLEHVLRTGEKDPSPVERGRLLRSLSASRIRNEIRHAWGQLQRHLHVAAHAQGLEAHTAWREMVKLLRSVPEVVVWWMERCANDSRRDVVKRALCIDALAAADLASSNMAAQRVIVNILASTTEAPDLQDYTLGSLSSVGVPGPPLVEELARAALDVSVGKRQYAHALGTVCLRFVYVGGCVAHAHDCIRSRGIEVENWRVGEARGTEFSSAVCSGGGGGG